MLEGTPNESPHLEGQDSDTPTPDTHPHPPPPSGISHSLPATLSCTLLTGRAQWVDQGGSLGQSFRSALPTPPDLRPCLEWDVATQQQAPVGHSSVYPSLPPLSELYLSGLSTVLRGTMGGKPGS